jgi:hypothetical protein
MFSVWVKVIGADLDTCESFLQDTIASENINNANNGRALAMVGKGSIGLLFIDEKCDNKE